MKKTWAVMGTAVAVSAMIFTGCGSSNTTTGTDTTQESENTDTAATDTPAAETAEYHLRGSMDRSFFEKDSRSGTGVYRKSLCLQNQWEKDTDRNVLF